MRAVTRNSGAALVLIAAGLPFHESWGQSYPTRPVRIIVGFVAGGGADLLGRIIAPRLSEQFGQPVIIENRPGGGTSISIERVAASSPDGHTLVMMTAAGAALPSLRKQLPYNLEADFAPVTLIASAPYLLVVHPSLPARSIEDLIKLARAKPGALSYGTSGAGTTPHMMGELFNVLAKVRISHVPYKGGAQSAVAVAANEIDMSYPSIPVALPLLEAGRVRPIAVTSARRTALLPAIPTISEAGVRGYDLTAWYGILAPAGTPAGVVNLLNTQITRTLNLPEVREAFRKLGNDVVFNTPAQFKSFLREEVVKHAQLIKAAGIPKE
jgi:tripartite-type tricarboxylate transporter receptor subunit TctC